jgi:hypothetical protein
MKTTIEIPDGLYRQVKSQATMRGQTVKAFFLEALQQKLTGNAVGQPDARGWRALFGKADSRAIREIQHTLDAEFSQFVRTNGDDPKYQRSIRDPRRRQAHRPDPAPPRPRSGKSHSCQPS